MLHMPLLFFQLFHEMHTQARLALLVIQSLTHHFSRFLALISFVCFQLTSIVLHTVVHGLSLLGLQINI
jgi:hypothetical protein